MEPSARLLVRVGAQPEIEYVLTREVTILGREAINDLVVDDAEVSRRHTRILREAEGYYVEDLGSTNGTFVNGQRVTSPLLLYHGDTVEMGKSTRLVFLGANPAEELTRPITATAPPSAKTSRVPDYEPVYEDAFNELEDSAEFYQPPSQQSLDLDEDEPGGLQRYLISCGCLVLLFLFLLGASLFILDRFAPDLLYCGPLQGFWEAILNPILNATDRTFACP
jgi:hypothetical protein